MYLRKQIRKAIDNVKTIAEEGRITPAQRDNYIAQLIQFNADHKGYTRYNFSLFFIFWAAQNIYNNINP